MVCKKCSAIIPDDGLFCPVCGSRADGNKPCSKCNKLIPDTAVFCVYCGEKVDDRITCPNCSALLPKNTLFCSNCGSKLNSEHTCKNCSTKFEGEFCPNCGTKYGVVENKTPIIEQVVTPTPIAQVQIQQPKVVTQKETQQIKPVDNETQDESTNNDSPITPVIIPMAVPYGTPAIVVNNNNNSFKSYDSTDEVYKEDSNDTYDYSETDDNAYDAEFDDEDNKNDLLVQGIICPQCGSNSVELISETLGKCINCNSQVTINTPKENTYVTNNVNIQLKGNYDEAPIGYFELPKEINAEYFYVEALKKIALDKNSPEDIFETAKFSPIRTEYRHYLYAVGNVNMTYSATVGYDRKEEYTTTKNEFLTEGSTYTYKGVTKYVTKSGTYTIDVVKERTVTDWKPFSGVNSGEYTSLVRNNDNDEKTYSTLDYSQYCIDAAKEYQNGSSLPTPNSPNEKSISKVKDKLKDSAKNDCEKSLPGDRHKDFKCNGTVELTQMECHVATQYVLNYKYMDSDYILYKHSIKQSNVSGDIPSVQKEIENEIDNNSKVRYLNIATLGLLLFSILSSILFPVALKIIFTLIGVASYIAFWVVRNQVSKNIYNEKIEKKKSSLAALLSRKKITVPKDLKGDLYL